MSLVSTLMQTLRTEYDTNRDKNEHRASLYGAYDLFKRQTADAGGLISPDLRTKIKNSFGHNIVIPVLLNQNPTIGNVRTCALRVGESTSAIITLTFATVAFGFSMYPALYWNNQIKYEQDFNNQLRGYINKVNLQFDNLCVAKLNAERNQFWTPQISAIYPVVANALQVSKAGTEDFYNYAESIWNVMDFYSPTVDVLASTLHRPVLNRLMAQGAGNDVNDAFQFGPFRYGYSNRVLNSAGIASTAYLVQPGTVAFENRNDPDSIMGTTTRNGKIWEEVEVPGTGLLWGSYYTDDCTDASAVQAGMEGLTRTKIESFEWSTDVCLVSAFNSNPTGRFQPIIKAEFSAT